MKVCKKKTIIDRLPLLTISTPHFCELIKNHERFVAEESITMLVTISSKIQNSVALLLFSIFDLTV